VSLKEEFKFSNERKYWVNPPFLISNSEYENTDWEGVDDIIKDVIKNQDYYTDEGRKALFNHAEKINFFSKEEFDDLDFSFGQVILLFKHRKPHGFRLTYSVKDDGTQKIHWKDVYGIWVVDFIDQSITNVNRMTMIDFD
jgi:hypothetical protein